jgi:hypothetical protein
MERKNTAENRVNMESSWNETAKLSKKHLARENRPNKSRTISRTRKSRSKSSSRSRVAAEARASDVAPDRETLERDAGMDDDATAKCNTTTCTEMDKCGMGRGKRLHPN